ncbi:trehalose-binding protein, partial [Acetobacter malorum]
MNPAEGPKADTPDQGPKFSRPSALRWQDWKTIFTLTFKSLISGPTTLVAAGCAFYTTLSLFPAISSLISIYGLAFDVQTVTPQLEVLRNLLPPGAYALIYDRIQTLVAEPHSSLTVNLVISLSVALWSASAAT